MEGLLFAFKAAIPLSLILFAVVYWRYRKYRLRVRHVFVVIHGETVSGPNPGLNNKGIIKTKSCRQVLPPKARIMSGKGKSQTDAAVALDVERHISMNGALGDGNVYSMKGGKLYALLPDNKRAEISVSADEIAMRREALERLLASARHNDVLVCDWFVFYLLNLLQVHKPRPASVYRLAYRGKRGSSLVDFDFRIIAENGEAAGEGTAIDWYRAKEV